MRSYVNNRVTGTDPRATWEGREQLRATELNVYDSPTIRWSQTVRGLRADVRTFPTPTPAQVINGRPFQVYNIANNSASPAQQAIYTEAAVSLGIPISIDDYTFQLRSGIIGVRSFLATLAQTLNAGSGLYIGEDYSGNFDELMYMPGTDWIGSLFQQNFEGGSSDGQFDDPLEQNPFNLGSGYIPPAADVLLSDNGVTAICSQIIVDPTPDIGGNTLASLWFELHDVAVGDPTYEPGITARLWGRRFYPGLFGQNAAFPKANNIIPLAIFMRHVPSASDARAAFTQVEQIQWGNLVNRYPPGVAIWRGLWTANNLANKVFYPNDEVFDDSAGSPGGNGWGRFTWIAAAPGIANAGAPHADNANWVKTSN